MGAAGYLQIILASVFSIMSAGFGSYVGIRVALTEIRGELRRLDAMLTHSERERADHDRRLRYLEEEKMKEHRRLAEN